MSFSGWLAHQRALVALARTHPDKSADELMQLASNCDNEKDVIVVEYECNGRGFYYKAHEFFTPEQWEVTKRCLDAHNPDVYLGEIGGKFSCVVREWKELCATATRTKRALYEVFAQTTKSYTLYELMAQAPGEWLTPKDRADMGWDSNSDSPAKRTCV